MEIKLNIYTDRFCRKVARVAKAEDFELSTGICEDVLNIINIDMLEGGLSALSDESRQELAIGIVKDGFPFFVTMMKELFDLTDEETKNTKIADIAKVVVDIVKYSFTQLASSVGGKQKN